MMQCIHDGLSCWMARGAGITADLFLMHLPSRSPDQLEASFSSVPVRFHVPGTSQSCTAVGAGAGRSNAGHDGTHRTAAAPNCHLSWGSS